MTFESVSALFAVFIMTIVEAIYLNGIFKGRIKPHMFSWFIWSLLMFVSGLIQCLEGGFIASCATFFGSFLCFAIAFVAYRLRGTTHITSFDCVCFVVALLAIPVWGVTSDPLWAAVLITSIDIVGFLPTYRMTWRAPENESGTMYASSALTDLLICLSLSTVSAATILYPASGLVTNGGLALIILGRRLYMKNTKIETRPTYVRTTKKSWRSQAQRRARGLLAQRRVS